MTDGWRLQRQSAWMIALLLLMMLPAGVLASAQPQGPAPEVRTAPAAPQTSDADVQATQFKPRADLLDKVDEALVNLECLQAHPAELKEENLREIEGAIQKLKDMRLSLNKTPRTPASCGQKYLDDARGALADAEPSITELAAPERIQFEATTKLLSSLSLPTPPTPSGWPSNLKLVSLAFSAFTVLLLGWHMFSQGRTKDSAVVAELRAQVADLETAATDAVQNHGAMQQVHSEQQQVKARYTEAPAVARWPEPSAAAVRSNAEIQTAGQAAEAAASEPESVHTSTPPQTMSSPPQTTPPAEETVSDSSSAIVKNGEHSSDPVGDYNRARELGGPEAEAAFKTAYAPCISVACTNLAQRVLPGVQFTFKPASRTSFLVATSPNGNAFLLPQFGTEYPFGRALMEGPFLYPSGETQELRLERAGTLESNGEEWVLSERGVFSA